MGVVGMWRWVGLTTHNLYSFIDVPEVLTDDNGQPVQQGTWNGETVIIANNDGSVARGLPGPPIPSDPYSPTAIFSYWEAAVETVEGSFIAPVAAALSLRYWWPDAAPHDSSVPPQGGTFINYNGIPLWDGQESDQLLQTNFTGNGYTNGQMTGTAPPSLTGNSGPAGTTATALVGGHLYDGAHSFNCSVNIGAQKNQWVMVADGTNTWLFQSRFTQSGIAITPLAGSVVPDNFAIGSSMYLLWECAVVDTFLGGNDASAPITSLYSGLGSTPAATVADSTVPNISVSYQPSCPGFPNGGDGSSPPTYRVLIRPFGSTSSFQLVASPQTSSVPMTYTITSATAGQPYSNNSANPGYTDAPHDQFVDLRIVRIWYILAQTYGLTQYVANVNTMKPVLGAEFQAFGSGLYGYAAVIMLQLAALDPTWVSNESLTWEEMALGWLRNMYTDNYVTPGVGMYVDVESSGNPSPLPGNTPLGQARFDYAIEAASMLYMGATRTWIGGGVTPTEQANWLAAANAVTAQLPNFIYGPTGLLWQQVYIDASPTSTPVYTYTASTTVKAGDMGDGCNQALLGYLAYPNPIFLALVKTVVNAIYYGGFHTYDPVNGGFWSNVDTTGGSTGSTEKEAGRLGFWLGVFRLLQQIEPSGADEQGVTWAAHVEEWFTLVTTRTYWQQAYGWPFRTNGDYTPFRDSTPQVFTETWVTGEAIGISLNQLLDLGPEVIT